MIIGGSDMTRTAMTMLAAGQWDAVCQDGALIPGAVSEALRCEPSVGSIPRSTHQDIEVGDYVDARTFEKPRLRETTGACQKYDSARRRE